MTIKAIKLGPERTSTGKPDRRQRDNKEKPANKTWLKQ